MCRLSLSSENSQHSSCQCTSTGAPSHLSGLKWRGSERSRGGCGSRVRWGAESSSEELDGFRERPGRVEDEGAQEAAEGSRERLSGGL